jgi:3'-5' exonuclease
MHIYLDIETIPGQAPRLKEEIARSITPPGNYTKAETIAKWEAETKPVLVEEAYRKTSFAGDRGEVICIGWAVDDEPAQTLTRTLASPEAWLLGEFFGAVHRAIEASHKRIPRWVGHNVRDFDLRFLYQRSVVVGVRPPFALPHDARPGSDFVFDTMTAWAGWGGRVSLGRLCDALGLPAKGSEIGEDDMDGSRVWDLVQAGRLDDVADYCRGDVERVRLLHQRLTFAAPQDVEAVPRVASAG